MFGFLAVILRLVFFFAAINFAAVLVFVRVLIFIFIFSILSFIGGVDGWDLEEAQLGALGATCRSRDFNPHPLERRVPGSGLIYPCGITHSQRKIAPIRSVVEVPRNALGARSGGEGAASDSKAKTGVAGSKEGEEGDGCVRRVHAGGGIGVKIGELASPPFVPSGAGVRAVLASLLYRGLARWRWRWKKRIGAGWWRRIARVRSRTTALGQRDADAEDPPLRGWVQQESARGHGRCGRMKGVE
ncbi:hypothetical protein B0H13DRAFT_1896809 [Mycena leptocephala]|nr:hypothetical protein B0H13DRAFT_1896809 [Mycena leptocephala]